MGLLLCSFLMLRHAAGSAEADKQALYGGVGVLLALVISRIDYSRLREYKLGLYAVMIALDLVVYGFAPIAGARRWIPLPGFSFQSSEFGKLLLIVALAGFAVDRSRQLSERRTTARIMLLALIAALLVIPEPDLGTGLVYVVDRVRDPVLRRDLVEAPGRAGGAVCDGAGAGVGGDAGAGDPRDPGLPGQPADGVRQPEPPGQTGGARPLVSDQAVRDRDRVGAEDRPGQQVDAVGFGLSAGARHGLRVRVGRRDLRLHRGRDRPRSVRAAALARAYGW